MAGFVLIHGSWHGGWCFNEVAARLRNAGHFVVAPDLPGMGGTEAELRAVTLEGWAEFAAEQCRELKRHFAGPVVLAGHSRGGIVVLAAAEHDPLAMDALVYICAHMLPPGMSRAQFGEEHAVPNPGFAAIIQPLAAGAGSVVDRASAPGVFAQLSPPDLAGAAAARLVAEPSGPRSTSVVTTPERWGSLPRTYVECSEDRTIPVADQRLQQRMSPGAQIVTLAADHSPFLSRPDELVEALIGAIP